MGSVKAVKIEFALIDDLKSDFGKVGGSFLSLQSDLHAIASKISQLKSPYQDVLNKAVKVKDISKEIGADNIFKIASEFEASAKERMKSIDNIVSKVNSL